MASRSVTLTIRIQKPWWTHVAFAGAKIAVRLGLPLNIDRFGEWLVGHFRFTTEPGER